MPKYIPVADKIADGLFAAKNRMFDFVQQRLNEGKSEKEVMKELKETVTADPSMLAEIEQTFFKKKAYFNPEILFSSMLYDINSLWEDGYVLQSEVNEVIDQYATLEDQIHDGTISESQAGVKFEAFAETYLVNAESRQEITGQFNEGYITEDEKDTRLSEIGKTKVAKFNPYRPKKVAFDLPYDFYFKVLAPFAEAQVDSVGRVVFDDRENTASFFTIKEQRKVPEKLSIDDFKKLLSEKKIKIITEDEYESNLAEVKNAAWIDDAKVGDQVELNDEVGEVTYIGSDKVEVKTPTKTETIWKN